MHLGSQAGIMRSIPYLLLVLSLTACDIVDPGLGHRTRALDCMIKEDFSCANNYAEMAILENEEDDHSWSIKGRALVSMDRFQDGVASLQTAIELGDEEFITWNHLAYGLSRLERHKAALDVSGKMETMFPEELRVITIGRGLTYWDLKEYAKSAACFERILAMDDQDAEAMLYFAECQLKLGKYSEALPLIQEALELGADSQAGNDDLHHALLKLERYDEALEVVTRYIENLDPALDVDFHAFAHNNRGYNLLKLNRTKEAMEEINLSISMLPSNPYAFRNRALVFLEEGNGPQACEDLMAAQTLGFADTYGNEVDSLLQVYCP